ncbi:hypothetical protein SNEBB_006884 [Seison nebaliae]|nr:hypothetical protein SNEBB_006884 [Seison nebaliae]
MLSYYYHGFLITSILLSSISYTAPYVTSGTTADEMGGSLSEISLRNKLRRMLPISMEPYLTPTEQNEIGRFVNVPNSEMFENSEKLVGWDGSDVQLDDETGILGMKTYKDLIFESPQIQNEEKKLIDEFQLSEWLLAKSLNSLNSKNRNVVYRVDDD